MKGLRYGLLMGLICCVTPLTAQNIRDTSGYLIVSSNDDIDFIQTDWKVSSRMVNFTEYFDKKGVVILPGWETSVVLEFYTNAATDFPVIWQISESNTTRIHANHGHDQDRAEGRIFSNQIFQLQQPGKIIIESPAVEFTIHFLYTKRQGHLTESGSRHFKTDDCTKPAAIAPSVWRKGLPDPSVKPAKTTVYHNILHHSAGSNTDTNYTDFVRNIYLNHTQVRGWDDIGYNYLIAQNGLIYSGRDPQGVADEDNIQGAHYCAKNSGTMGICLLGDYEQVTLPPKVVGSALELLAWKLFKENMTAFDARSHPFPTGDNLTAIAGHRDGCSTLCPGKHVYQLLDSMRFEAQRLLDNCPIASSVNPEKPTIALVEFGPEFTVTGSPGEAFNYRIIEASGKTVSSGQLRSGDSKYPGTLAHGLYILQITDSHKNSHIYKLTF